jgi:hypothetical protein
VRVLKEQQVQQHPFFLGSFNVFSSFFFLVTACKEAAGQTKNLFLAFFNLIFLLSSSLPQPAKKQALEVIKELQKTMKIERAQMKLMIRLPKASAKPTKAKIEPMITSVGALVPLASMRQAPR